MCGIFAVSRLTEVTRKMAPVLAWTMQNRGQDSWGMSNGVEVKRFSGPHIVNYQEPPTEWDGGPVMWHNRGASFRDNASKVECAHPFTFLRGDGTEIVGIHNGVIRNHVELNGRYGRKFPVDSMHIWANLAEEKTWKDLWGWGNLVWFEEDEDEIRRMHFARINDKDLHAMTLKDGTMILCSLPEPIFAVARMFGNPVHHTWKVDEYKHYTLGTDEHGKDIPEIKQRSLERAWGPSPGACPTFPDISRFSRSAPQPPSGGRRRGGEKKRTGTLQDLLQKMSRFLRQWDTL